MLQPNEVTDEELEAFRDSVLDEHRNRTFPATIITAYGEGEFTCQREWIAQSFGAVVAEALRGDLVRPTPRDPKNAKAQTHGFYGWLSETTTTLHGLVHKRPKQDRAEALVKGWYYGAAGVALHQGSWEMLNVIDYDLVDMHDVLVAILEGRL